MPAPSKFLDIEPRAARRLFSRMGVLQLIQFSTLSKRAAELVKGSGVTVKYDVIDDCSSNRIRVFENGPLMLKVKRDGPALKGVTQNLLFLFNKVDEPTLNDGEQLLTMREMVESRTVEDRRGVTDKVVCTGTWQELDSYMHRVHRHIVYIFSLHGERFREACPRIGLHAQYSRRIPLFIYCNLFCFDHLVLEGKWNAPLVTCEMNVSGTQLTINSSKTWVAKLEFIYGLNFRTIEVIDSSLTFDDMKKFVDYWRTDGYNIGSMETLLVFCPITTVTTPWPKKLACHKMDPLKLEAVMQVMSENGLEMKDCRKECVVESKRGQFMSIRSKGGYGIRFTIWKTRLFSFLVDVKFQTLKRDEVERKLHSNRLANQVFENQLDWLAAEVSEEEAKLAELEARRRRAERTAKSVNFTAMH